VTGVSIGEARRRGKAAGLAVCIHVSQKVDKGLLPKAQRLPTEIAGVPVDVVESSFSLHTLGAAQHKQRRLDPQNPIPPGVEIGALHSGEFGTVGAVVVDLLSPAKEQCLLTAAHVLDCPAYTLVYQPCTGEPGTMIGHARRRIPHCDAALAVLHGNRSASNTPLGLTTPISGCREVGHDDVLVKSGMMTGVTRAVVKYVGEFRIPLGAFDSRVMVGFVLKPLDGAVDPISDKGDSGAVWYDEETGEGVGLHIGGDAYGPGLEDDEAFACNLNEVLKEIHAEIVLAV
jgi:hypothetical protein